jgi:hypothetical protein
MKETIRMLWAGWSKGLYEGQQRQREAVDNVATLSYTDYIDVAAEQNKLAMEFAKTSRSRTVHKSATYQTVDLYGKWCVKKQT